MVIVVSVMVALAVDEVAVVVAFWHKDMVTS
jgi:hypothetical protein